MTTQTLQERINEKAAFRLRKHLYEARQLEDKIQDMLGRESGDHSGDYFYKPKIKATYSYRTSYSKEDYEVSMTDEFTKKLYDTLLPNFINKDTDDILKKIAELDYFIQEQQHEE